MCGTHWKASRVRGSLQRCLEQAVPHPAPGLAEMIHNRLGLGAGSGVGDEPARTGAARLRHQPSHNAMQNPHNLIPDGISCP